MTAIFAARREIVRICRRLYERGLIAGPDGNVSVRLSHDRILITPAGMSKVDVTEQDLVEIAMDGEPRRGSGHPSSEAGMHLRVYRHRPDVHAVVHAHPPIATGFAVAGESFSQCVLPEMILQMGSVPLVPYATPGSEEVADLCEPYLREHNALLLANHGATTMGSTLTLAHQRMESLEHTAHVVLVARLLGRVNTLSADAVQALMGARARAYPGAVFPGCETPPASTRSSV